MYVNKKVYVFIEPSKLSKSYLNCQNSNKTCLFLYTGKSNYKIVVIKSYYLIISLYTGKSNYKIVVRKTYWDTSFDAMLLHNSVALNLLHTQVRKTFINLF